MDFIFKLITVPKIYLLSYYWQYPVIKDFEVKTCMSWLWHLGVVISTFELLVLLIYFWISIPESLFGKWLLPILLLILSKFTKINCSTPWKKIEKEKRFSNDFRGNRCLDFLDIRIQIRPWYLNCHILANITFNFRFEPIFHTILKAFENFTIFSIFPILYHIF